MNDYTQQVYSTVLRRNPGEQEFHQAVKEVLGSLDGVLEQHPEFIETGVLERLVEPEKQIMFRVPWIDDKNKSQVNRGYRVQFNSAIGPYKGGLRFNPNVTLGTIKFLGFEQIFKNSLTGLSMGGGKGGSDFDPKGKSDTEVMKFCQSFMTELANYIGPNTDVPAGDIGVGAREIGFLFGQYKRLTGEFTGVLTGKGPDWGGSLIRPEATGYGAVYFCENMLASRGDSVKGKTAIISGSGNVAQYTVEKINQLGGKAVTLSDTSGFIHDPSGINEEKLAYVINLKNKTRGRISDYADKFGCSFFSNEKPWGIKGDLVFPSATQNELDEQDALTLIKNKSIAVTEGANMPCTPEAVELFQKNGVLFGPAKAANAGGVAVSGFEMAQNSQRVSWSREKVEKELQDTMQKIHLRASKAAEQYGCSGDLVRGANIAGFLRVASAMSSQGYV